MTNQTLTPFFDPNNFQGQPHGKGKRQTDPRWNTCPIGQAFFIERTEEEVRNNKKRPSIPASLQGKFKTKSWELPWGYMVTRTR